MGRSVNISPRSRLARVRKNPRARLERVAISGRKLTIRGKKHEGMRGVSNRGKFPMSRRIRMKTDPRKAKRMMRKLGVRVNPTKQVLVQRFKGKVIRGDLSKVENAQWVTIAMVRDNPEMRELAKRFARTYKKKHPKEIVRVITE